MVSTPVQSFSRACLSFFPVRHLFAFYAQKTRLLTRTHLEDVRFQRTKIQSWPDRTFFSFWAPDKFSKCCHEDLKFAQKWKFVRSSKRKNVLSGQDWILVRWKRTSCHSHSLRDKILIEKKQPYHRPISRMVKKLQVFEVFESVLRNPWNVFLEIVSLSNHLNAYTGKFSKIYWQ